MSVISGILSADATNNASDAATKAQNNATDATTKVQTAALEEGKRQFDTTQANFAPYKAIGDAAAPELQKFNATGGGDMTADPLYKNQMSAATREATQRAAGSGQGTGGGALQTRLAQLGNQVYNNTYATKYQQLTDAIKVGQGAAGSISTGGSALSNQAQSGANNLSSAIQSGANNIGTIATNNANTQASLYGGMSTSAATLGSKLYSAGSANGWWGGSGGGAATTGGTSGFVADAEMA